ncbi:MAG: DinB family protein [Anaerolineae bacterium]|nr:DinB family protein [Anaerolineae bacterium]
MMDTNRKFWNEQQQVLQRYLADAKLHAEAIELALRQHAMVHTAAVSRSGLWSFEDEIWDGLDDDSVRRIPANGEHSIAWVFWHLTRVEDVTMNLLVAGTPQVIREDRWFERMKAPIVHTGNAMSVEAIAELSAAINIDALRDYRLAVGERTQEIIYHLEPVSLKQKVRADRLNRIYDEGAVLEAAREIVDYWGKRTVAGLLLMPATRHHILHLNEAARIKNRFR